MIIHLDDQLARDTTTVGAKAARLAIARAAGLPVPPGFVVTAQDAVNETELLTAAAALGGPLAVRSSGVREDAADSSSAGLYESYLDVPFDGVLDAVRRCRASGASARVTAYRGSAEADLPVLVQAMVAARAAGVAFSADPVTGERDRIIVTAVAGLGEPLMAGLSDGEEWVVTSSGARCRRPAGVLTPAEVAAVAEIVQRVCRVFPGPQDVEWAVADDGVLLLQARPMTALPPQVTWSAPGPGLWVSNFRIGEWLPEPVTPLFAEWFLPGLEGGFQAGMRETTGASMPFDSAIVNSWYYTRPTPSLGNLPKALLASRGRVLWAVANILVRPGRDPAGAARTALDGQQSRWRDDVLPSYLALASRDPEALVPEDLFDIIDRIAHMAGRHLWYLAAVGGAAWKMESALSRFLRRRGIDDVDPARLLRGLDQDLTTAPDAYAVYGLDWFRPTHAEAGSRQETGSTYPARFERLKAEREHLQDQVRAALADRPQDLRRWNLMLATAQRYAMVREEQARTLTLGWPLARRCVLSIGEQLVGAEQIGGPEDAFFLRRAELTGDEPLHETVARRRADWSAARRLSPPLVLGEAPRLVGHHVIRALGLDRQAAAADALVSGQPASPGIATGPVRIVSDPEEFPQVESGDVLVARTTTPAWTPLFDRVCAVITDSGTAAAHASLIAREYGIPAVVATGNATRILSNGQMVTVDGRRGTVRPAGG